jgi:hypothetical protein
MSSLRAVLGCALALLVLLSILRSAGSLPNSASSFAVGRASPHISLATTAITTSAPQEPAAAAPVGDEQAGMEQAPPPTVDSLLAKKLAKLEAELRASEAANAKLRGDAQTALREENARLKNDAALLEDLGYWSMKLWAEAASRRSWDEYACYGPPEDGAEAGAKSSQEEAWKDFGSLQPRCGCIRKPESVAFDAKTCVGRRGGPDAGGGRDEACKDNVPWVLFAGDSTMRQLFEESIEALAKAYACEDPFSLNATAVTLHHDARDDEARFTAQRKFGAPFMHFWDSETVCMDRDTRKPVAVISYRSHQGMPDT